MIIESVLKFRKFCRRIKGIEEQRERRLTVIIRRNKMKNGLQNFSKTAKPILVRTRH